MYKRKYNKIYRVEVYLKDKVFKIWYVTPENEYKEIRSEGTHTLKQAKKLVKTLKYPW